MFLYLHITIFYKTAAFALSGICCGAGRSCTCAAGRSKPFQSVAQGGFFKSLITFFVTP
ncbi:hypothetical protein AA14362_2135 [Acetobacter cerevisiae DSM 14362]|nr:hypothetical protein AA14362_2135 [Acetobacter cerevisiae DSM 14362]